MCPTCGLKGAAQQLSVPKRCPRRAAIAFLLLPPPAATEARSRSSPSRTEARKATAQLTQRVLKFSGKAGANIRAGRSSIFQSGQKVHPGPTVSEWRLKKPRNRRFTVLPLLWVQQPSDAAAAHPKDLLGRKRLRPESCKACIVHGFLDRLTDNANDLSLLDIGSMSCCQAASSTSTVRRKHQATRPRTTLAETLSSATCRSLPMVFTGCKPLMPIMAFQQRRELHALELHMRGVLVRRHQPKCPTNTAKRSANWVTC